MRSFWRLRRKAQVIIIVVAIAVTAIVGVSVIAAVQRYLSERAAALFAPLKEEARAACAQCFSLSEKPPSALAPYRRGKVLVVEANTGEVTSQMRIAMAALSPEVRAANPEEVGTLVCAGKVRGLQVSTYPDGKPANKLYRDICIYDLSTESLILFDTLYGGPPPLVKSRRPKSGPDPVGRELISLLEALPVK